MAEIPQDPISEFIDEKKLITGVVSNVLDRILRGSESAIRRVVANYKLKTQAGFEAYIARQFLRHSKIKNFLLRDQAVSIDALFVEPLLTSSGTRRSSADLLDKLKMLNRVVLLGPPGSGKTLLAKKMLLESLRARDGFLPVFVELRQLSSFGYPDVTAAILGSIRAAFPDFMQEQLISGLEQGVFTLILDGFDEVDRDKSKSVQAEILKLSNNYSQIRILLTSRPIEMVRAWNDFIVYRIEPQTANSIAEMVRRLPYDEPSKQQLISFLESRNAIPNYNILSNPLMCLVMLPSFKSRGSLVRDVDYFDACIETLMRVHDEAKEAFDRPWKSGLGITHLRRCVAAFSLVTYLDGAYSFSNNKLRDYVGDTKRLVGLDFDVDAFVYDLTVNLSILEELDFGYEFQYRQFQEYLAATNIVTLQADDIKEVLDSISERQDTDSVLRYAHELNSLVVEQSWSIGVLQELQRKMDAVGPTFERYWETFAQSCFVEFLGTRVVDWSIKIRLDDYPIWAAMRLYKINGLHEMASDALRLTGQNENREIDAADLLRINKKRREAGYVPARDRPLRRTVSLFSDDRFARFVLSQCKGRITEHYHADRKKVALLIGKMLTISEARSKRTLWGRASSRKSE